MKLKTSYLVGFTVVGMIIMTFLVLNMEVKKEVRESIQKKYDSGGIPRDVYKDALSDGKLSYWEAMTLKDK